MPLQARQWYWPLSDTHPGALALPSGFLTPALSKWSLFKHSSDYLQKYAIFFWSDSD